ncbi:MAG: hypothetical protein ACK56I_33450, partial [bacterium]
DQAGPQQHYDGSKHPSSEILFVETRQQQRHETSGSSADGRAPRTRAQNTGQEEGDGDDRGDLGGGQLR